ncbi:MAG: PHB depolymerase family esterase [Pseudomonadota bacterium]
MTLLQPFIRSISVFVILGASCACQGRAAPPTSDDVEVLVSAFEEAHHDRDWARAIEVGLRLDEVRPNDQTVRFNLACVYALHGDHDKAVDWLTMAAKNGLHRVALIEKESDLDSVRDHPGYAAALERVKSNYERRRTRTRTKFERQPPPIYLPPRYDETRAAPLIIALHGLGGWGSDIADAWRDAAGDVGAILVAPEATRRLKGSRGFNWIDSDDAGYIVELTLDYAKKKHQIDPDRVILTGFSQGGFMAYAIATQHPDWFTGVIPMGTGYLPSIDAPPPVPEGPHPRYYFMVGASDPAAPQTKQAAEDFATAGYTVELEVYPSAGHVFPLNPRQGLRRALTFVLSKS